MAMHCTFISYSRYIFHAANPVSIECHFRVAMSSNSETSLSFYFFSLWLLYSLIKEFDISFSVLPILTSSTSSWAFPCLLWMPSDIHYCSIGLLTKTVYAISVYWLPVNKFKWLAWIAEERRIFFSTNFSPQWVNIFHFFHCSNKKRWERIIRRGNWMEK